MTFSEPMDRVWVAMSCRTCPLKPDFGELSRGEGMAPEDQDLTKHEYLESQVRFTNHGHLGGMATALSGHVLS